MEILNLIFNAGNVQTLILLIAIIGGFVWSKSEMKFLRYDLEKMIDEKFNAQDNKIDARFEEQDKKLDERFLKFYELLKANDFAHLNRTIKALTFTLEKNKILDVEDKKYVDSHLDEK